MQFETKRLTIRNFLTQDYQNWENAYSNRLPPQNEFDVGRVPPQGKKYFYDFLSQTAELGNNDKIYVFGAFDSSDGKFIGVLEIISLLRSGFNWGSIGISVHNQFWGQGFGTEIAKKGLEIAKDTLDLRRLECAIEQGNQRSVAIFSKLGFEFECTRKAFAKISDSYCDMDIYSKII